MDFKVGDKVLTTAGLYMDGEWRERGQKGKVVEADTSYGGLLTVKFKGIKNARDLRPEYVIVRKTKKEPEVPEVERPFSEGDTVYFRKDVFVDGTTIYAETPAEVLEIIPDSNLIVVAEEETDAEVTVAEELVGYVEDVFPSPKTHAGSAHWGTEEEGEAIPNIDVSNLQFSPEVVEGLDKILARLEEIKELLTTKPQNEFHIYTTGSNSTPVEEEEPAPEPVFKKAKEVKVGDSLYTEAGVWDKVDLITTKDSGYTSLYGVFGNEITQVPSGRMVQVLEEVA